LASSGFTASLDGDLTPEVKLPTVETMTPNVTFMRFRDGDGNPLIVGGPNGQTASDWKLTEPSPGVFQWVPE
jgi:hypothetical protein